MRAKTPLPEGLVLGDLVRYYDNGWYFGYLAEVSGTTAKIKPIRAYKAVTPRCISVRLADVQTIGKE